MSNTSILSLAVTLHSILAITDTIPGQGAEPWVVYEGQKGPGFGHHIVFVTGDDQHRQFKRFQFVLQIPK